MKIAILGAGHIGASLGKAWSAKGHDVVFAVRHPDDAKTREAVAATDGKATVATTSDAVRASDVVVVAIPFGAVASALEAAGDLTGKIVVDCTNPVNVALPPGVSSGAELVARLAKGARVVKSFNAQGVENIAAPRYRDLAASNFYCGDDADAKAVVRTLIADVGFDPIDAGPLANAKLVEAATMLWFGISQTLGTRRVAFRILREG